MLYTVLGGFLLGLFFGPDPHPLSQVRGELNPVFTFTIRSDVFVFARRIGGVSFLPPYPLKGSMIPAKRYNQKAGPQARPNKKNDCWLVSYKLPIVHSA